MSLLDDLIPYRDGHGFVQPKPGEGSYNGGRYTGDAIAALWRLNQLPRETCVALIGLLNTLEKAPGVVMRTPDNLGGHQGPDDIIARISAYHFLGDYSFHYRFRAQSRREATWWEDDALDKKRSTWNNRIWSLFSIFPWVRKYNHNNVDDAEDLFHVSTWFGRMPHLYCHNNFAMEETPPWWQRIWWALAIGWSPMPKKKHEDKWTNSWHMVLIYNKSKKKYWYCSWAVKRWQSKLKKVYPHGIGEAFESYWGEHPINLPLWDDFGDVK